MDIQSQTQIQIIPINGRMDAYAAEKNRKLINSVLDSKFLSAPNLVINLEQVNFIDSTGLSLLVQTLKKAREHNGDVRLCSMQQSVRMIFELTRLDKVFEIFVSEEEAVRAFSR
jgi:anti-sigma B factor antagonist